MQTIIHPPTKPELFEKAKTFLQQFYAENDLSGLAKRLQEVGEQIYETGTYHQTVEELSYGAKLAWRNSNRCIGRLFWKTLKVLDFRDIKSREELIDALHQHLELAQASSKIRSVISIFPPQKEGQATPVKILNYTLLKHAVYTQKDGSVVGDPKHIEFTNFCQSLGWQGKGTKFDLLPVVFQFGEEAPQFYELPTSLCEEVKIQHPEHAALADLGLQWYKLPVISNMDLEIGGIHYPGSPFNGWYMLNEIAARNFADADRYNLLPVVAEQLKLCQHNPFWKDKALLILNEAVYHSFQKAGATLVDHHTACEQFMLFVEQEEKAGREITGDWSWLVPPVAGSTTEIFHREWNNEVKCPNFFLRKA